MIDTVWLAAQFLAELSAVALGITMISRCRHEKTDRPLGSIAVKVLTVIFVLSYFTYRMLG